MSDANNPYSSPQAPYRPITTPSNDGNQKPISIMVFGILHLVFGVFGLCGLGGGLFSMVIMLGNWGPGMAVNNPVLEHPAYMPHTVFSLIIGFVLTCMKLSAGILLLNSRELGRKLSVAYGIGAIINVLSSLGFQTFLAFSLLNDAAIPEPARMGMIFGMVIGGFGLLLAPIYPGLTIFFMTRASVKSYLQLADSR